MAFTERYVTQAAGGGGDGSSGSPWTFAEAITHSLTNTGQRYNVQSDGAYSVGATTFGAGAFDGPNIWRGYNTTIGDCDNLGRNADGTLNTTGMPAITVTGSWTMANHVTLQNLNITGSLSSQLVGELTVDYWRLISCRVANAANDASARALLCDNSCFFLNCDFICSGASHNTVVNGDSGLKFISCRFETTASVECLSANSIDLLVLSCVFLKNGSLGGIGLLPDTALTDVNYPMIVGNTFYNLSSAIESTQTHTGGSWYLIKNHATDCTQFITNTTNIACYDVQNRTRDNTSPPATVELITLGAITTDTGGPSTDYTNTATGDLHLITTAAGYNAGWDGSDIGGLQTNPPATGGGGSTGRQGLHAIESGAV